MSRQHLTRQEAAVLTGFSVDTLAKWATLNKGPRFTKFGKGRTARVRYPLDALQEFMRTGDSQLAQPEAR